MGVTDCIVICVAIICGAVVAIYNIKKNKE